MTRIEEIKTAYGDVVFRLREALPHLPVRIDDKGSDSYRIIIDCGHGEQLEVCDDDIVRGLSSDRSAHYAWQIIWSDDDDRFVTIYRRRGDAVKKLVRAARQFCENNGYVPEEDFMSCASSCGTGERPPVQAPVRYSLPGSAYGIIDALCATAALRRRGLDEATRRLTLEPSGTLAEQAQAALEHTVAKGALDGAEWMLTSALRAAAHEQDGGRRINAFDAVDLTGRLIKAASQGEPLDRFFTLA